jgi:Domain of unknown function (DUF4158)
VCTLPWLGFVPDDVASAPPAAVARLAEQLRMDPEETRSYGCRAKARTDHLRLAAQYLGWRAPTTLELKELDEFLLARGGGARLTDVVVPASHPQHWSK